MSDNTLLSYFSKDFFNLAKSMVENHPIYLYVIIFTVVFLYFLPKLLSVLFPMKNLSLAVQGDDNQLFQNSSNNIINNNHSIIEESTNMTKQDQIFNINAPSQINNGGSGNVMNVNHQRKILNEAKIEKSKRNTDSITRLILEQTNGMWDAGTKFELQVYMSGPYKEARIIQGLPGVQIDRMTSANAEKTFYGYSMISAPLPDQSIIFEAISDKDIDITSFSATPF